MFFRSISAIGLGDGAPFAPTTNATRTAIMVVSSLTMSYAESAKSPVTFGEVLHNPHSWASSLMPTRR
jgi:hypothetical protein